eukprot:TRINITY_DN169_c2_g2_i5.p1 TRINITY_DN169_c2_g2~~TRINITY_DN169_c2_g2_i5.p1  ORF type:complete len:346 (+),score=152.66 TRINITY_DN169_c2_g2_i5:97-1134(+)
MFTKLLKLSNLNNKTLKIINSQVKVNFYSTQKEINNKKMNFRFAGCQTLVGSDKLENLKIAESLIIEAVQNGAKMIALPECFNCPYSNDSFKLYAEQDNIQTSQTLKFLSNQALKHQIYLIGGSIPEIESEIVESPEIVESSEIVESKIGEIVESENLSKSKYYNTCYVFDPNGNKIAKHRKVHLFDINIPGKITFQESLTLSQGNQITFFDSEFGRIGIGICYDIRFSQYANALSQIGCNFICYPGAFNLTTGPAHWELLQRARALDNQIYISAISPARNPSSSYQAWGHSTVVDPWGTVIATCDHNQQIIYADIDFNKLNEIRQQIPITKQKRNDLYSLQFKI